MIVYREVSTLSFDLGIPVKTLYAVSNNLGQHYHTIEIPKRDNTCRRLTVPDEVLKKIQRSITEHLLVYLPISRYATAYRFGASTFRNAAPHTGKQQLLKLDIRHFFDSILYATVKNTVFPPVLFSEPLRVLLTMLCYYRESLPQGAPSSPAITNIIMRPFDECMGTWCEAHGVVYTRYCDDMTFSGSFDAVALLAYVRAALRANGFFLNEKKTQRLCAGQRQTVTGLTVNEGVNIPAEYRRKLRQELYYAQTFGIEAHLRAIGVSTAPKKYLLHLLGQVQYVLQSARAPAQLRRYQQWLVEQLGEQDVAQSDATEKNKSIPQGERKQ